MSAPKLFQPIQIGDLTLGHRIVMAPLTRFRANDAHVPGPLAAEYYAQRASEPGTLIISEATFISPQAGGLPNVPGIYSDDQISAWCKITDAVHAKGSYMFLQLWALGRTADPEFLRKEGGYPYVSAGDIKHSAKPILPRPLTILEIKEYIQWYADAASAAVHKAGFDGVEVHGAGGYLVDQFFQDVSNNRTDKYGGSVENRARFSLEVIEAISRKVGVKRTAIRFTPWGTFQDMRMRDPVSNFTHLITRIRDLFPDLAYIHVTDPRSSLDNYITLDNPDIGVASSGESNDFIRELWGPRPVINAGGFSRATAMEIAEKPGNLVAFGRAFIANPDLPLRLKENTTLSKGDRRTYYVFGSVEPTGYTDYPFSEVVDAFVFQE